MCRSVRLHHFQTSLDQLLAWSEFEDELSAVWAKTEPSYTTVHSSRVLRHHLQAFAAKYKLGNPNLRSLSSLQPKQLQMLRWTAHHLISHGIVQRTSDCGQQDGMCKSSDLKHVTHSHSPAAAHPLPKTKKEAHEVCALLSLCFPNGKNTALFVVGASNQNYCQPGCWCSSKVFYYVDMIVFAPSHKLSGTQHSTNAVITGRYTRHRMFTVMHGSGPLSFTPHFQVADKKTCLHVCTSLQIPPQVLGVLMRAVIVAAHLNMRGGAVDWSPLELLVNTAVDPLSGKLELCNNYPSQTEYKTLKQRGGLAVALFPDHLAGRLPVLTCDSADPYPESPWGLAPRLYAFLCDQTRNQPHNLRDTFNSLAGWKNLFRDLHPHQGLKEHTPF